MSTVPTLPGITSQMIQTNRLKAHVLSSGPTAGTAVVFVHGNVSSATFWEETMLALPDGYRGIAIDLRGYGDTEPLPINGATGMADWAADVHAVVETMSLGKHHIVGHSMGGGIVMLYAINHAADLLSITLVDPVSPYGYGGSKGADGAMTFNDGAPSGINPEFVQLLANGESGLENPMSPRNVLRGFYVKPPFISPREDELVASMLTTKIGDEHYPGNAVPSTNWPGAAPGDKGVLPAFNRKYFDASALTNINPKPPILWVRGADDLIVSDYAMFDLAALGHMGAVPGWPGDEVCPPQPMLAQTRAVLDSYAANGGSYREEVIEDAGHSPYLEQPAAFNAAFHGHLAG
ncbi:MAG: alpha/beta hydrolase [Ardenticatenaceae bacterium]|nr:alpha/beta hydrolase [Anaerolineales bacterium]MCB8939763.1 alpha/beta hydrolase [Ardenticatenaceae bacterium]MCB8975153.1 alpha/beta hydrolase [Ardenticatenaceae bacterium]